MGFKSLSLQMVPWCFHMMGGGTTPTTVIKASTTTVEGGDGGKGIPAPGFIKLIRTDGKVEVYHRPVSASELMSEHPSHLVCRSDAFTIGQRVPALPEGEELEPGHAYFLLPVDFFQSVLSFVTLASFARAAASSNGGGSVASVLLQRPFDVQKTPSGKLQIRVSEAFVDRIKGEPEDGGGGDGGGGSGGKVCTTAALEKDYRQLVAGNRARQWKPKLETILESEMGRGRLVSVAATVALGGIRWRRKTHEWQGDHHNHVQKHQQRQRQRQLQQQEQQKQKQQRQRKQRRLEQRISVLAHYLRLLTQKNVGKKVVACNL